MNTLAASEGTNWIGIGAILSPVIMVLAQAWILERRKKKDYERQDLVASRVETASRHAREAAEELKTYTKTTTLLLQRIESAIEGVHKLTDGGAISEMKRSLVALRGSVVMARRVRTLTPDPPTDDESQAMAALEDQVKELECDIESRQKHAEAANLVAAKATMETAKTVVSIAEIKQATIAAANLPETKDPCA